MKPVEFSRHDNETSENGKDKVTKSQDALRSKSAGKALQRVFHQEELHKRIEEQKASVTFFMNANRRKIFIHLCSNPCDHVRGVARSMKLSAPAATWHLRVLCESGHLSSTTFKKKKVFWPAGMVRSGDVEMISSMRMPPTISILTVISKMPERKAKENALVSKLNMSQQNTNLWLGRLVKAGLLNKIGNGPGTIYTFTRGSLDAIEHYKERAKGFSEGIIYKLDADGLRPRKAQVRGTRLYVQVTLPSGKERQRFECHPLADLARILK